MARNGSGTYSLPSGNPVVAGTTISSTDFNNTMSDIATALTASIAKDGQTTPSANLPMGTYRHTGVGAGTALTDYARYDQLQNSAPQYLTSVSGADTITAAAPVTPAAYAAGQTFRFIAVSANTGAVTLNVSSLGAKSVTKNGTTALVAGDIVAGAVVETIYDGTRFQLATPLHVEITGVVKDYIGATAPAGYVFLSGLTIGNAASSATERANADTEALFTLLWNSMGDTEAPVSSGRGASAAADYAANKTITLPDARGRVIVGKDNMGGTTASRITAGGCGITGTTLGTSGGTQTHTLTTAEMPEHTHYDNWGSVAGTDSAVYRAGNQAYGAVATSSAGSDGAHNNTQPSLILNKIIKL